MIAAEWPAEPTGQTAAEHPRRAKRQGRKSADWHIGHLVLVVGFQGAGKSTFIEAWRNVALPPEILAALPPVDRDWPEVQSKKAMQLTQRKARSLDGLLFQYDLMRGLLRASYRDDQALDILKRAKRLTVVLVEANEKQLAKRLVTRSLRINAGRPVRLPIAHFSPQVSLLTFLAQDGVGPAALHKLPLIKNRWSSFQSGFHWWRQRALETYLRQPQKLADLRRAFLTHLSLVVPPQDTMVAVVAARATWRQRIGWSLVASPVTESAEAGAQEASAKAGKSAEPSKGGAAAIDGRPIASLRPVPTSGAVRRPVP